MSNHGSVVSICHRIIPLPCIKQVVLAFCKQNKRLANSSFPFQLWTPYQGIAKISSIRVKCVTDHIGFGFCFSSVTPSSAKDGNPIRFLLPPPGFSSGSDDCNTDEIYLLLKDHWIGNFPDLFTDYRVLFVPSPSGITSDLPGSYALISVSPLKTLFTVFVQQIPLSAGSFHRLPFELRRLPFF